MFVWKGMRRMPPGYAQKVVTSGYITSVLPPFEVGAQPLPEIKDLGTAIEPIVGYREFYVGIDPVGGEPTLLSLNGTMWPPKRKLVAFCGNDLLADHTSPHIDCNCGIYAWDANHRCAGRPLQGEVSLWGDVLIGEYGYRAEYAYPRILHISPEIPIRNAEIVREGLEERYGIPVVIGS